VRREADRPEGVVSDPEYGKSVDLYGQSRTLDERREPPDGRRVRHAVGPQVRGEPVEVLCLLGGVRRATQDCDLQLLRRAAEHTAPWGRLRAQDVFRHVEDAVRVLVRLPQDESALHTARERGR
jgi:hypothetical protein